MAHKLTIDVPLNRVEGDLEVRVEVDGEGVSDAWACGTLYRGFEKILVGRAALDALVITPRICGVCTSAHLVAAARALDSIAGTTPPAAAVRIRNVALMTEHLQSDMRHAFLTFAADFVNPAYAKLPLFEEAVRRYQPFQGETVRETVRETSKILEILVIIGGQWPHSSFIVPGGIISVPSPGDLLQCRLLLRRFRTWYEGRILGCTIERWQEVRSAADLERWLEESDHHRNSDLGFYLRYGKAIGLDRIGRGPGAYLSFGSLDLPNGTQMHATGASTQLVPAGFTADGGGVSAFDERKVNEQVTYSWAANYEGGRHPMSGETQPYATGQEAGKYSWAKAPRYDGAPTETGPLAEAIIAGHPLFSDLISRDGPSVFVRELARLVRATALMPSMEGWLTEASEDATYYKSPGVITDGEGVGLIEATRGALGHWVRIEKGVIQQYQIITPTAWNASCRDADGTRGPMEEALVGTPVRDVSNPIELGHVVRSFDPCLVCTVHAIRANRKT